MWTVYELACFLFHVQWTLSCDHAATVVQRQLSLRLGAVHRQSRRCASGHAVPGVPGLRLGKFHTFSMCSRCSHGIWTLFPRAPCSGSHLPLCVATVHGSFWTNFVYFLHEKWTPSSSRSSHLEFFGLFLRACIWKSLRASEYGGFWKNFNFSPREGRLGCSHPGNLDIMSTRSQKVVGWRLALVKGFSRSSSELSAHFFGALDGEEFFAIHRSCKIGSYSCVDMSMTCLVNPLQ